MNCCLKVMGNDCLVLHPSPEPWLQASVAVIERPRTARTLACRLRVRCDRKSAGIIQECMCFVSQALADARTSEHSTPAVLQHLHQSRGLPAIHAKPGGALPSCPLPPCVNRQQEKAAPRSPSPRPIHHCPSRARYPIVIKTCMPIPKPIGCPRPCPQPCPARPAPNTAQAPAALAPLAWAVSTAAVAAAGGLDPVVGCKACQGDAVAHALQAGHLLGGRGWG